MPGRATANAPVPIVNPGDVRLSGRDGSALQLIDARPPLRWSDSELAEAVERQQKRAGPLVALVKARLEQALALDLAELNRLAGGQASHRVASLARNAMIAQEALELQRLHAEVQVGEEGKGMDNALRNLSGLSVFASQALDRAYEAAREEGKAGNPVSGPTGLLAGLGVLAPGSTVTHGSAATPPRAPDSDPGVGAVGAPLFPNSEPK